MSGWGWVLGAAALIPAAVVLRRPLKALGKLALRSGLWMVFLWLFRGAGGLLGIQLGVNLFNGVVLGVLGIPGLALLMLVRWAGS